MSAASGALVLAVFVACVVETIEAATVVMAMGLTRGWKSAWVGTAAGLALLVVFTTAMGYALTTWLPRSLLQLIIGTLLLIFGLQWLRKAVLRASGREGLHDESAIYRRSVEAGTRVGAPHPRRLDSFGVFISFKSTFLEGVEVVFIVLTFGLNAGNLPLAIWGALAAVACVVCACFVIRQPLSRVPENTLKYVVSLLLTTFGLFWSLEGIGVFRAGGASLESPLGEWAILIWLAVIALISRVLIRVLRVRAPSEHLSSLGARAHH